MGVWGVKFSKWPDNNHLWKPLVLRKCIWSTFLRLSLAKKKVYGNIYKIHKKKVLKCKFMWHDSMKLKSIHYCGWALLGERKNLKYNFFFFTRVGWYGNYQMLRGRGRVWKKSCEYLYSCLFDPFGIGFASTTSENLVLYTQGQKTQ